MRLQDLAQDVRDLPRSEKEKLVLVGVVAALVVGIMVRCYYLTLPIQLG